MKLKNTEKIRPLKDHIVVDVQVKERKEDEVYLGEHQTKTKVMEVEILHGIVEKMGPVAQANAHAPGVEIGDKVLFSEFAGNYIATNDDKLHKILKGYDIMATTEDLSNINEITLTPVADRVLVEVLDQKLDESGLYLDTDASKDPRLVDISYGKILKRGSKVGVLFNVGEIVGFEPYVGEALRKKGTAEESELRVIRCDDIMFTNG